MIDIVSVLCVLLIQIIAFTLLLTSRNWRAKRDSPRGDGLGFWVSILGGALPIGLLGAELIERDGVAVLLALLGFVYFILVNKS